MECFFKLKNAVLTKKQSLPPYSAVALKKSRQAYAPGRASFFYSPDCSELWCAYHGVKEYTEVLKPTPRYLHLQKVDFDESGYPVMGVPIGENVDIVPPSGEIDS